MILASSFEKKYQIYYFSENYHLDLCSYDLSGTESISGIGNFQTGSGNGLYECFFLEFLSKPHNRLLKLISLIRKVSLNTILRM